MYKSKDYKKGFTLIEMMLVLGLVSVVAVVSVSFSLPVLAQFSCAQKAKAVGMALERTRHKAQFLKQGNVTFEVSLVDEFEQNASVPVVLSDEIIFEENSGNLLFENGNSRDAVRILIGGNDFGCSKTIVVSPEGAIL